MAFSSTLAFMGLLGMVGTLTFLAFRASNSTVVNKDDGFLSKVMASDCANRDYDNWAPADDQWCYIRMYKCSTPKIPEMDKWWGGMAQYGLQNANTGDLTWGAGGKAMGIMTCGHYGKFLEIWKVKVKRNLMTDQTGHKYHQCNGGKCGAPYFGWRYKDQDGKPATESKRQFAMPIEAKGEEWDDGTPGTIPPHQVTGTGPDGSQMGLERVVTTDCIKKTTYNLKNMEAVESTFKRDVMDSPVSACEPIYRQPELSPWYKAVTTLFQGIDKAMESAW